MLLSVVSFGSTLSFFSDSRNRLHREKEDLERGKVITGSAELC
jgi:hypothetical protein